MKKIYILAALAALPVLCLANLQSSSYENYLSSDRLAIAAARMADLDTEEYGEPMRRLPAAEQIVAELTTTGYGELASLLAENPGCNVLKISGQIDEADFTAIFDYAWLYPLELLDLSAATVKDNTIPDNALYDPAMEKQARTPIRSILLPDSIIHIGKDAFSKLELQEINIPTSLQSFGLGAFSDNNWLDCSLVIPEGVTELPPALFFGCYNLSTFPQLPQSLKSIESICFSHNHSLTSISLPEGLEKIEFTAFSYCYGLESVYIPDSCLDLEFGIFSLCESLKTVRFPENLSLIPNQICKFCYSLDNVIIPSTCKEIEYEAFALTESLKHIALNEGLVKIGFNAFMQTGLETICLPSTLETIGDQCFEDANDLRAVYCKATVPPAFLTTTPSGNPHGTFSQLTLTQGTLYVPVGSQAAYAEAIGWKEFSNIVETATFPDPVVGVTEVTTNNEADTQLYDLMGRKVVAPQPGAIYIQAGKKVIFR